MILVAGGTGRLGTLVVERLVRAHQPVRVLTRDPARATHLPAGVEVSRGNVCDTAALPAAFIDVNCVVSAVHGLLGKGGETPQTVDGTGNRNLVDAAAVAGADMVLVSIMGARSDHPLELFRMKAMAERYLLDSGVPATVVRSAAFEELHVESLQRTAGRSGRPIVFGRGFNPINFVPVGVVADAVVGAIFDETTRGRLIDVCGVDRTYNELAATALERLGRPSRSPRHVPRPVLRALAATGWVRRGPLARQAALGLGMDTLDLTAAGTRSARSPEN